METMLQSTANVIAMVLQAVAIVVVVVGSVRAIAGILKGMLGRAAGVIGPHAVWFDYARWLVAALTFQLGADIVATSFAPTWEELARLALVAAIRTFLSFFLDREIERASKP